MNRASSSSVIFAYHRVPRLVAAGGPAASASRRRSASPGCRRTRASGRRGGQGSRRVLSSRELDGTGTPCRCWRLPPRRMRLPARSGCSGTPPRVALAVLGPTMTHLSSRLIRRRQPHGQLAGRLGPAVGGRPARHRVGKSRSCSPPRSRRHSGRSVSVAMIWGTGRTNSEWRGCQQCAGPGFPARGRCLTGIVTPKSGTVKARF